MAGVREVAAGAPVGGGGDGEGAQPRPVRGRLVDDVHAGHVANVVDVKRLLQAHDQNLKQHISSLDLTPSEVGNETRNGFAYVPLC